MVMSAAAMEGVQDFGLPWKHQIKLADITKKLADQDNLVVGDCKRYAGQLAERITVFLRSTPLPGDARTQLMVVADDLEHCPDDPDELNLTLETLYDRLDYYRICMVDR